MEVIILPSSKETGALAADAIEALVRSKPNAVLGLATGSSPLPIYDELARRHDEEGLSFTQAHGFALDEYVGLPVGHYESYREVIRREFTNRVDVAAENVHGPDGAADDILAACSAYEQAIKAAGGIDLQILGVGTNGHIGFNEPSDEFSDGPFKVKLTESTITSNKIYFDTEDEMPRYALTMGIGDIMRAKKIVFIATGEGKAKAVYDMIEGPVSPKCPASILQNHKDVIVFLDKGAAKLLK